MTATTRTPSPTASPNGFDRLPYVAGGHKRQCLDLFLPRHTNGPVPVLVWIQGGDPLGRQHLFTRAVRPFVADGFAVARLHHRSDVDAAFPAQIHDCKAAVRWLRAEAQAYGLDAKHIGVWGEAAGGFLAALLGTTGDDSDLEGDLGNTDQSSAVQAVVDFYGPTEYAKFVGSERTAERSSQSDRSIEPRNHSTTGATPVQYVSEGNPPFLIIHGDKDVNVPLRQSELLANALANARIDIAFHILPGVGHAESAFYCATTCRLVSEFLSFYLKEGDGRWP